jgi:hypothetical protein
VNIIDWRKRKSNSREYKQKDLSITFIIDLTFLRFQENETRKMNSVMRAQKSGFAHAAWEKVREKPTYFLFLFLFLLDRFNQNMMLFKLMKL